MANFAGTCTSDNKGLLLLLLDTREQTIAYNIELIYNISHLDRVTHLGDVLVPC